MDSRELVELAKALTQHDNVRALRVTLLVEDDNGVREVDVHSNDDLFRPFHVGELAFDDAQALVDFVAES